MTPTTITLEIPADIAVLCEVFGITPEQLLCSYMGDLTSGAINGGSDERRMSKDYFLRSHESRQEEWLFENAERLMEHFHTMYGENYPAVTNTDYAEKRVDQLQQWKAWAAELKKGFKPAS